MSYEVFLDVLFLRNLLMDYLLLRLVNLALRKNTKIWRSIAGSVAGALLTCIWILIPQNSGIFSQLLVQIGAGIGMVSIGFAYTGVHELCRIVFLLWALAMGMGGIWQYFCTVAAKAGGFSFFLLEIVGWSLIGAGILFYRKIRGKIKHTYQVVLCIHGKCKAVKGLYDTGNQLRDRGKPVCVVEEAILNELFGGKPEAYPECCPHYIPYRTVGKQDGVLLVVTLETLWIKQNGKMRKVEKPLVAFSQDQDSFLGEFGVILHPDMID